MCIVRKKRLAENQTLHPCARVFFSFPSFEGEDMALPPTHGIMLGAGCSVMKDAA